LTKDPHQNAAIEAQMMRGVLPNISSTAGCLAFQKSAGGQVHDHRRHAGSEYQRCKATPDNTPIARVTINFGEDVTERCMRSGKTAHRP